MKKICKKCKIEKDLDDFYKHFRMKDGYVNFCKECQKERVRNNPNRFKNDIKRSHNPKRKQDMKRVIKKYELKYPHRIKVGKLVNRLIKKNKLKRLPCEICGNLKSHGHHDDYNKPLKIIWLCQYHHKKRHKVVSIKD